MSLNFMCIMLPCLVCFVECMLAVFTIVVVVDGSGVYGVSLSRYHSLLVTSFCPSVRAGFPLLDHILCSHGALESTKKEAKTEMGGIYVEVSRKLSFLHFKTENLPSGHFELH